MLAAPSETWTFFEGEWREGNTPIMGPRTHGAWMSSGVFDGARRFEGGFPDLDQHCMRVNRSAQGVGLQPAVPLDRWIALALEAPPNSHPHTPPSIPPPNFAPT